jgi:amino acid transporter
MTAAMSLGHTSKSTSTAIGFWEVAAIGVGGMVGGGIFAVLGLAVQLAHGGTPIAFAVAGSVALVTAYSYVKLSVAYPSRGGTVAFLDRAFGPGLFTGAVNVLLWMSYIVMLSLYAYAFGSYGASFLPSSWLPWSKHALITASVLGLTGLNMMSADLIGRAETWIVGIKVAILLLFAGVGVFGIQTTRLAPSQWSDPLQLVVGGMIIFLAYEGFELMANAADDVRSPETTLPRAFYATVGFVIALYVAISAVAVGSLPVDQIVAAQDYALAEAARPIMGGVGFTLIGIAALLSTASAINATLYGAARLSYVIAKDGELPAVLERRIWNEPLEGLLITTGLTLVVANLFQISSISSMGSAGFLLVFAAVNGANAVEAHRIGSRRWLAVLGVAACLGALGALVINTLVTAPRRTLVLVVMVGLALAIEGGYRLLAGRPLRLNPAGGDR